MTQQDSLVRFRKGSHIWDVPATVSILDRLIEAAPMLGIEVQAIPAPELMEGMMDSTVIKAFSDMDLRVQQILKSDLGIRSRESAIARVASAPIGNIDWEIWQAYKAAAGTIGVTFEPTPGENGGAYAKLEKKARKLRKRDPLLSQAGAFARAYELYPELAAAQKSEHLAGTMMVVKTAPRRPALNAYEILQQEREAHIAKAVRAGGVSGAKT